MDEFLTAKTAKLLRLDRREGEGAGDAKVSDSLHGNTEQTRALRSQLTSTYSDTVLYIAPTSDSRHVALGRQPYTDSVIFI